MKTVEAAKILDQITEAETYAKKLLVKIQNAYRTRKINIYDYEGMINLLTCKMLINEDIQKNIKNYINTESEKQIRHFDIRV